MAATTFTVVNDKTLVASIAATTQALVYVAPGITRPVVDALAERLDSQSDLQCTLILDLDPEVYRLGYGTEDGLIALQALATRHHLELRQQEGIRIGLLIADGQTLLYSPTPHLIEAGSVSVHKPNAVMISAGGDSTAALMQACAANGAASQSTPIPQHAEIGQRPATPVEVSASLAALKDIPPKVFDVARIERVFESKIQFVEIELTGYRLSSKKVSVPNDLLVGEDSTLKQKLKNSLMLLQGDQMLKVDIPEFDPDLKPVINADGTPKMVTWSEAELEKQRKALYEDFLINVPRFGQIIMRNQRKRFDDRIALLCKQIEAFKAAVAKTLGVAILEAIDELAKALLPRIRENLPPRYSKFLTVNHPADAEILGMIKCDLEAAFGGVNEVFNPELRCVFKDVTYESIQDKNFKKLLSDAMRKAGGENIVRQLFSEHDAAPETNRLFPPSAGGVA